MFGNRLVPLNALQPRRTQFQQGQLRLSPQTGRASHSLKAKSFIGILQICPEGLHENGADATVLLILGPRFFAAAFRAVTSWTIPITRGGLDRSTRSKCYVNTNRNTLKDYSWEICSDK